MIVNKTEITKRIVSGSMELSAADIFDLLRKAQSGLPQSAVPTEVRIYFAVPGGGDWSNTSIDIDMHNPVRVEWKIEEVIVDA